MSTIQINNEETIAAISTPIGEGGISVIRISGPKSHNIAKKIFKKAEKGKIEYRKLHFGKIIDNTTKTTFDDVLCTFMKAPKTYTGEDIVEIHSHGGYIVPKKILELVLHNGARPALPGEFTNRAFMNGKMDLAQAEAVADIINAQTEKSLKQAENQLQGVLSDKINTLKDKILDILAEIEAQVDFPEEDIDPVVKKAVEQSCKEIKGELNNLLSSYKMGKIIKEGVYTAIIGKPNVGKSSILNSLIEKERAIVSEIPGTTRDFIEEIININGIALKIVDTAGIRTTSDEIEKVGVGLALKKAREAEFLLIVLDQSRNLEKDDLRIVNECGDKKKIFIINKSDIERKMNYDKLYDLVPKEISVETSAKNNTNISELKNKIYEILTNNFDNVESSELLLTNIRHKNSIENALKYLSSFTDILNQNESPEFLSIDLRSSLNSLGEITGEVTTEDVLGRIFSKFCIGK